MVTTIQVSEELRSELEKRKLSKGETYEDVVWDLIEDTKELSEQTLKDIEKSRADYKAGRFKTLEQLKKELGFRDARE